MNSNYKGDVKVKKIKDYIYLDQRLLNSILAQFGEGLIVGSSVGEETTEKSKEATIRKSGKFKQKLIDDPPLLYE